jgi:hypothetical protein
VRYDGPFGTPPRFLDPSDIHTAIIIVGGIGCTPMMSMLAYINSQVLAHGPGVLGGLSKIKVLWSAQMPAFFDIFADTIKSLQKTCPDRIEFQVNLLTFLILFITYHLLLIVTYYHYCYINILL